MLEILIPALFVFLGSLVTAGPAYITARAARRKAEETSAQAARHVQATVDRGVHTITEKLDESVNARLLGVEGQLALLVDRMDWHGERLIRLESMIGKDPASVR